MIVLCKHGTETPRNFRILSLLLTLAAIAFVGWPAPASSESEAAGAPAFIEALGDVPLMPGLTLVDDAGVAFDAPGGRIVEVLATGPVQRSAVVGFYRKALPQLGWSGREGVYLRDGERLRLEVSGSGARTQVRFFLSPAR